MPQPSEIFPVENPTTSHWLSEPHRLASYRSSETVPREIDIAIIGTGLAGVATAYHILKRSGNVKAPKIALFEARQACSGATGRNGGHIKVGMPSLKRFQEQLGSDKALELFEWVAAQRRAVKKAVDDEGINCDMLVTRSYDVFHEEKQAETIKKWLFEQQEKGLAWTTEIQWLEGPNLDRITGTQGAHGAISVPALSFWPYKFVMGLLERIIHLGGGLYTETPVHNIDSISPSATKLVTSRGICTAKKVVFATNGYSAGILPQFHNVIVPVRGQAAHLVPNWDTHHGFHPVTTYNLFYDSTCVDYLNPRPDGTIVLGGGGRNFRKSSEDRNGSWWNNVDDSRLISPAVKLDFDKTMERYFRGWEKSEARVDITWTGIMGSTKDALPHAGLIPGSANQWILAGFNGGGMAMIFTLAKAISGMVLHGETFEQAGIPGMFKTTPERLEAQRF